MINRRRGETELVLGDKRYRLCLTLGALAELEAAFAVEDLSSLAERFNTGAALGPGHHHHSRLCATRGRA